VMRLARAIELGGDMSDEKELGYRRRQLVSDLQTYSEQVSKIVRGGLVSATGATGAAIISGQLDTVPGVLDIAFVVFLIGLCGLIIDYLQYVAAQISARRAMSHENYLYNVRWLDYRFRSFGYFGKQLALAACVLGISYGVYLVWLSKSAHT
jgi:hypothetical protein